MPDCMFWLKEPFPFGLIIPSASYSSISEHENRRTGAGKNIRLFISAQFRLLNLSYIPINYRYECVYENRVRDKSALE